MPWRYFARPHPVGAWVCSPVERAGPEPPGPGLVEEQPPDDGKVATVDPLIGLLGMQVRLQPKVQWHHEVLKQLRSFPVSIFDFHPVTMNCDLSGKGVHLRLVSCQS